MDGRFGRGACVRMFREEELNEMANMEASQQHQQQPARHVQNPIGQPGSSSGSRR